MSRIVLVLSLLAVASCTCGDGSPAARDAGAGGSGTGGAGGGGSCTDADHDGTCASADCDDSDPARHRQAVEVCDGVDQDCDRVVDDGLFSCATCERCGPGAVLPGTFDPGPDTGSGVSEDPAGGLALDVTVVESSFAWIANGGDGTVSKIDTRTGREVARYPSARPWNWRDCADSGVDNTGACPSRTAVDGNGDVFVANRAFGQEGSVTKIANLACPDRNGDGAVTTSSDLDGDGHIDVQSEEFKGDADECVLYTVDVGMDSVPRALALDAGGLEDMIGSIWVGLYRRGQLLKLRNEDGAVLGTFDLPEYEGGEPLRPYGAAIDRSGRVWVGSHPGDAPGLAHVDATSGEVSELITPPDRIDVPGGARIAPRFYGIAVDEKQRVWLGGWAEAAVIRFDPASGTWAAAKNQFPVGRTGNARGLAVERRGEISSRVWVAFSSNPSALEVFDADTLMPEGHHDLGASIGAIGAGLDDAGKVWAVNQRTGDASWFDPATGKSIPVRVGPEPYTYSDFTGYARRNFTAPRGTWKRRFDACDGPDAATYRLLDWDAVTPPGTGIEVHVRVAATEAELASAPRLGPFVQDSGRVDAPVDLTAVPVPDAAFALVEVVLRSEHGRTTPVLRSLRLDWSCPGPDLN